MTPNHRCLTHSYSNGHLDRCNFRQSLQRIGGDNRSRRVCRLVMILTTADEHRWNTRHSHPPLAAALLTSTSPLA